MRFERETIKELILRYKRGELKMEDLLIEIERIWPR
jgi:hypothetical protein